MKAVYEMECKISIFLVILNISYLLRIQQNYNIREQTKANNFFKIPMRLMFNLHCSYNIDLLVPIQRFITNISQWWTSTWNQWITTARYIFPERYVFMTKPIQCLLLNTFRCVEDIFRGIYIWRTMDWAECPKQKSIVWWSTPLLSRNWLHFEYDEWPVVSDRSSHPVAPRPAHRSADIIRHILLPVRSMSVTPLICFVCI